MASAKMTIHGRVTASRGRSGLVIFSTRQDIAKAHITDRNAYMTESRLIGDVYINRNVKPLRRPYQRINTTQVVHLMRWM